MNSLATPRVPSAPLDAALYESHYLTATDPAGGRALWLRHTALKRPGEQARPTVWVTWFDLATAHPRALRVTASEPVSDPGQQWSRSALGELSATAATGAINGASWQLTWEGHAGELPYLPARRLYDRPVPRSNGVALVPAATVHGTLTLDDEPVSLDGWDGIVGHNWGSEHADHWSWLHAGGLGDDRSGWLDLALARIKIGRLLTPWLAAGALHLDGRTYATAPGRRVRRAVEGERTSVSVSLTGGMTIELAITAPDRATVSWDYSSPSGTGRDVRNCSVADAVLTLRSREGSRDLAVTGRVAVEHGAPAA
jgi:hypothetical protein